MIPENEKNAGVPAAARGEIHDQGCGDPSFSDEELLSLLADVRMGKTDAFSLLYDRYRPLIEASVVRFSNRFQGELSEEYSELEEEAVIALYRAAVSYEPGRHSTFGLYARVCIRNRLISCVRKHAKRLLGEAAATEEWLSSVRESAADPEEAVLSREAYKGRMEQFLSALAPLERDVFRLYVLGNSCKKIAEQLSVSEKSAENAVYRIRKKLKVLLGSSQMPE